MKKEHFINDLKGLEPSLRFESTFLVRSKETRVSKNGNPYLSLKLADRTGEMDTKVWDNVNSLAPLFEANDIVHVRGRMQVFNDQHQMIVTWLRAVPDEEVFLGDFVPHTEHDVDAMYAEVLEAIDQFSNANLKRLMRAVFRDPQFAMKYKQAPAAKANHHAKVGGLLEHVVSLLRLAKKVASHYPDVDSDLLACGVLLHDAGKIFELSWDRTFDYTDSGRLLGHIAIGSAWISRRCDEIVGFPARLKTLLLHLVLSHHGKLEYGSPQVPLFPEALVLHFIDDLDAKLEMMREARAAAVEGSVWSGYHNSLGRFVLDKDAYLSSGSTPPAERQPSVHDPAPAPPQAPVAPVPDLPDAESLAPPAAPQDPAPLSDGSHREPQPEVPAPERPRADVQATGEAGAGAGAETEPPAEGQSARAQQPGAHKGTDRARRKKRGPAPSAPRPSTSTRTAPSPPLPMQPTLVGLEPAPDETLV